MNDVNYEPSSRFFIFNKTFYKEQLIKIFEENVDKINQTHMSSSNSSYLPNNMLGANLNQSIDQILNSQSFEQNSKILDKYGITLPELKKLNENLTDSYDNIKGIFKSSKVNSKICEKIRDNYNFQFHSLECIYKNISVLYE